MKRFLLLNNKNRLKVSYLRRFNSIRAFVYAEFSVLYKSIKMPIYIYFNLRQGLDLVELHLMLAKNVQVYDSSRFVFRAYPHDISFEYCQLQVP